MNLQDFIYAIQAGDSQNVEVYLQEHPDALQQPLNRYNRTALHLASCHGHLNLVKYFLNQAPELLESTDCYGQTPLFFASASGNTLVLDYLLQLGANYQVRRYNRGGHPSENCSAIEIAQYHNHQSCVELIMNAQLAKVLNIISEAIKDGVQPDLFAHFARIIDYKNTIALKHLLTQTTLFQQIDLDQRLVLLSIAHQAMHKELLRLLVSADYFPPKLVLEKTGFNLIQWAISRGLTDVVELLIDNGEPPEQKVMNPESPQYGFNLLKLAYQLKHYETLILLVARLINQHNHEQVLGMLTSGVQALDLAAMAPETIPYLINNERILMLIEKLPAIKTEEGLFSYQYKNCSRRRSFLAHMNFSIPQLIIHKPEKKLGQGARGMVRLGRSENAPAIAIKSVINCDKMKVERELHFLERHYAGKKQIPLLFFKQSPYTNTVESRLIMPFFKGEDISRLIAKTMDPQDLAEIILKMAQALLKMAQQGFVHGDVKEDNILGYKGKNGYKIHFIDFDLSADFTWGHVDLKHNLGQRYAPERVNSNIEHTKPATNQDVYSLGYLIKLLMQDHPSAVQLFTNYPVIDSFITKAIKENPAERPLIDIFCHQLNACLTPEQHLAAPSCSF